MSPSHILFILSSYSLFHFLPEKLLFLHRILKIIYSGITGLATALVNIFVTSLLTWTTSPLNDFLCSVSFVCFQGHTSWCSGSEIKDYSWWTWETIWYVRNQTWIGRLQANALPDMLYIKALSGFFTLNAKDTMLFIIQLGFSTDIMSFVIEFQSCNEQYPSAVNMEPYF